MRRASSGDLKGHVRVDGMASATTDKLVRCGGRIAQSAAQRLVEEDEDKSHYMTGFPI